MTLSHTWAGKVDQLVPNVLTRYYAGLTAGARLLHTDGTDLGFGDVLGAMELPALDDDLVEFLSASEVSLHDLGDHGGRQLVLLNLMRNPRTRTTKTFGSLGIVLRAAAHVRRTGERIMLLTPTSGNKGTALRDAVGRAIAAGLVDRDQLRVVTVTPAQSRGKLRSGALSADPALARLNPVTLADVDVPVGVKDLAREVATRHGADLAARGWQLWYTLGLDNYRIADSARAFVEAEFLPGGSGRPRVHAHAVSGAWGLLGYEAGLDTLEAGGVPGVAPLALRPGFFLVQHLATPEMILSQARGGTDAALAPEYRYDQAHGVWTQDGDPLFPAVTVDPREVLDTTFYTSNPPTIPTTDRIIHSRGGGGVVVSKLECLRHYQRIRDLVTPLAVDIPADPADLHEWSLVMVLTGVFNAIERDLLPPDAEIVVHGTGSYSEQSLPSLPLGAETAVGGADDLAQVLHDVAGS
ncbi:hypothetical protein JOD54_005704 [Actinokineospora baliensis]|uniref:DUF6002 family protein n=1 Tax=Actinokineospora baliensis TaxID=547056 RepID=UPI00195B1EC1|nr:DUF6002 family protein [Actinokineospora baliensis]MBM7775500.1 hypothetical protein [Actinokineospora baliensis]